MIEHKLIITKTPLRISFFGGGTDMPYFYENVTGQTVSVAIDQYLYVIVKTHNGYDEKFRLNYSVTENVETINSIKNLRAKSILKHFKINIPIYISTISDIPANTGMGSSSSFTVGLIKAITILKNIKINKKEISELAYNIESNLLKEDLGKQDQYIASYGSARIIEYKKNSVSIKKINLKKIKILLSHSLVFFTGQKRVANNILRDQKKNKNKNYKNLIDMKILSDLFIQEINKRKINIKSIGDLFKKNWVLKKKLSQKISNKKINTLYEKLIAEGCLGGKLLGAGNGGFLFMILEKKLKKRLIKKYKKYKPFEPHIDHDGSKSL